MKFNEYELVLTKDKLNLHVKQKFNEPIEYIDDMIGFVLKQYNLLSSAIEKFFAVSYDCEGNINGIMQVGTGDYKTVDFNFNSIFKFLLLNNAFGCILIHNHLTTLTPSNNDYDFHYMAKQLCTTLNIDFLANLILCGKNEYYNILTDKKEKLIYEWKN